MLFICKKIFISFLKKIHSVKKKKKKKFISVNTINFAKKNHFGKKSILWKRSHRLKNKFYFQFSFGTNEQV